MNCLTNAELLDRLFGEAAPESSKETHLAACPACRGRLAALKAATAAASSVQPTPVSEDFTARLMARIGEEAAPARARLGAGFLDRLRPRELAFAAGALALLTFVYFKAGGGPAERAQVLLVMTDGPSTPAAIAAPPSPSAAGPDGVLLSDFCVTARCGL